MSSVGTLQFSRGRERSEPGAGRPRPADLAGSEGEIELGKGDAEPGAFIQAEMPLDFFEWERPLGLEDAPERRRPGKDLPSLRGQPASARVTGGLEENQGFFFERRGVS